MLLLGTLHVSGCGGDDGEDTSSGTTGGQQTTSSNSSSSSSGGTPGSSSSSGGEPSTTSASTGGDGGADPAGTGGADPAGTGGSDPAGTGGAGAGGGGTGGGGDGGSLPDSGIPPAPGGGNVPKPAGGAGGFKVVDWAGFAGAVTYSFDDVNQTQIQHFDEMMALDVPFTFYVWTGKQEANNAVWKQALTRGHELANHTRSHSSNDNGSDTDAATKDMKDKYDVTPYTMAAPNGAGVYEGIARTRFMINRGVSNALIGPNDNSNPFVLPTYIPPTNASKAQMDSEVSSARSGKKWRTFCIHGFTGGNDGAYQPIPFQAWVDHVKAVKAYGDVWIGTMETIGAYWRGQKAITDGTNTKNGNDTTYNWTLPTNFPPGKYVRVTVTGGTLKQNGAPLKWDPHGYYEVALDAKSVTLSP
ncbi:polysaccharide deacetylase family protein [Sorangium atrum]|uniref:Polysaccharide deacetylase family protein n=1 Tax=Sorangium atrum TaxID=2995308 RepID=A0ABT5CH57_9BACT|nr:polysaccharide deacetylase family protein [Sorangium aterium]MDC0685772.1 polysaccharide deacetylase family protein [Sorangium aterium]